MRNRPKLFSRIAIALFLILAYFPLFWRLDALPYIGWDESLFAMRAHYLAEHGALMKTFSEYSIMGDYPNNKPPFTTLLQAISFKLFGYNELALRLPIALLGLATLLLMLYLSKKVFGNVYAGILSGVVLITMENYVDFHAVRTGDHDAALAFYMLLGLLAFYAYTTRGGPQTSRSYLLLFLGATTAGFLTKSVVAFFFFPGFAVYLLYKKQLKSYLRVPSTYWTIAYLILLVVGYYGLMELYFPGFLDLTKTHTLGRYTDQFQADWDTRSFDYYFLRIWKGCWPGILLLPLGWFAWFGPAEQRIKDLIFLLTAGALSHLLIISASQTKFDWYDTPVLPLLALLAGIGLYYVFLEIKRAVHFPVIPLAAYILLILFFLPYQRILQEIYSAKIWEPSDQIAYLIKANDKKPSGERILAYTINLTGRSGAAAMYGKVFGARPGYRIELTTEYDSLAEGEYIMSCEKRNLNKIHQRYVLDTIDTRGACAFVKIVGRRAGN